MMLRELYCGDKTGSVILMFYREDSTLYEIFLDEILEDGNPVDPDTDEELTYIGPKSFDIDNFIKGYMECALWSSCDHSNKPLDEVCDISDFDPDLVAEMKIDCYDFISQAKFLLDGISPYSAGHDFWLTRNGHGAGFWDRGLGDIGEKLSNICKTYGSYNLFVEYGMIYGE